MEQKLSNLLLRVIKITGFILLQIKNNITIWIGPSTSRKAFVGTGFKLGSDDVPSQSVGEASAPAPKPREFVLKVINLSSFWLK